MPPLLRPGLQALLVLMPVVAVLAFRSGDLWFATMAATQVAFCAYALRYGIRPDTSSRRSLGLVIATAMVVTGVATLVW